MNEKAENFRRISKRRVEDLIHAIKLIGNLSGPSYEFTPAEVVQMFDDIDAALIGAKRRFETSKSFREAKVSFLSATTPEPTPTSTAPEETEAQEQIRLQQQVIEMQQKQLDELRRKA